MALPVREQFKYWGAALAVFLLILWVLGDVILPFLLGAAVAYILDPVADALQRLGLSRVLAVVVMTFFGLVLFVLFIFLVVPTLVKQGVSLVESITALADRAPTYLVKFQTWLAENHPGLVERFPDVGNIEGTLRRSLTGAVEGLRARTGALIDGLLASFSSVMNALVLFVIVPVVAFYLLVDWDRMVARIDDLLPREHAPTIRDLARQMDRTLASFIRGQGTVCLILGVYYAVALMALGLKFGLVIGAVAGLLTFIPYIGALVGGVLAIGMALFQFWGDWLWVILVWAIFQSGQFVEGNILTPKLVGAAVRLHPVWLLFALAVFGALFGFVGLLVAVPVAAVIGVLARFFVHGYLESDLYRGTPPDEPGP